MRRLGAYIGHDDQIGIELLLFTGHLCPADDSVLHNFALNRIAGFIEKVAVPDLIAHCLTAQLLLLIICSIESDQV